MSAARPLVLAALALRGVDVALDVWVRSLQLVPLVWALVRIVTAILLRAAPRAGTGVVLVVAFVSVFNAYAVLHPTDDFDLIVPFFQVRRVVWLVEAALLVAAAILAVAARVRTTRRDVVSTPPQIRRPLVIGAGCWAAALGLIFWWPGTPWANYLAVALIPIALLLRFWMARQLRRGDAILARVAGWIGVVWCLLTLTPIAYGLVIVYLLMTVRGTALFALALFGTFFLLTGAKRLRATMRASPHSTR
jgi:hypothetical protein